MGQSPSELQSPPQPASEPPRPARILAWDFQYSPAVDFILFLAALLIYLLYVSTSAPGPWWGDGLELAAAAKVLGVAHPTGYPLYLLIAHVAMRALRWIEPGRVTTLLSAGLCAGSTLILGRLFFEWLREQRAGDPPEAVENARLPGMSRAPLLAAVGIMLMAGFSRTLWEHATFTEVYPLTFFLVCAIVWLCAGNGSRIGSPWRVAAVSLLTGLALLNHYSFIAVLPLVLLRLISWGRATRRTRLYNLIFFAMLALCSLGYLYLPIRASAKPPINWGDPVSLDRILWVLGGGDYVGQNVKFLDAPLEFILGGITRWSFWWGRQFVPERIWAQSELAEILTIQLGGFFILGSLFGVLLLCRRRLALALGLFLCLLITLMFSVFYRIPDLDAYFLPAIPAALLGWAEVGWTFMKKIKQRWASARTFSWFAPLPALIGMASIAHHYGEVDKAWDDGPARWAGAVLSELPENSLVLTGQGRDSEIYALWYEQIVKGTRPDVRVYGTGFIFSPWYAKQFPDRPDLPPVYVTTIDESATEQERAQRGITALTAGVILPHAAKGKVFSTYIEPTFERYMNPREVRELLPAEYYRRTEYKLNPPGPALFELTPDPEFIPRARERFVEIFGHEPPE